MPSGAVGQSSDTVVAALLAFQAVISSCLGKALTRPGLCPPVHQHRWNSRPRRVHALPAALLLILVAFDQCLPGRAEIQTLETRAAGMSVAVTINL